MRPRACLRVRRRRGDGGAPRPWCTAGRCAGPGRRRGQRRRPSRRCTPRRTDRSRPQSGWLAWPLPRLEPGGPPRRGRRGRRARRAGGGLAAWAPPIALSAGGEVPTAGPVPRGAGVSAARSRAADRSTAGRRRLPPPGSRRLDGSRGSEWIGGAAMRRLGAETCNGAAASCPCMDVVAQRTLAGDERCDVVGHAVGRGDMYVLTSGAGVRVPCCGPPAVMVCVAGRGYRSECVDNDQQQRAGARGRAGPARRVSHSEEVGRGEET